MSCKQSKTLKVRSDQNLEFVKNQPCKACGKRPVDPHHIRSRGAGGGDELGRSIPDDPTCDFLKDSSNSGREVLAGKFLNRSKDVLVLRVLPWKPCI